MMFKKGSFEVGGKIYPVAIKVGETIINVLCICLVTAYKSGEFLKWYFLC